MRIAAGGTHTCAVTTAGVKCWGNNSNGEVGSVEWTPQTAPVRVGPVANGAVTVAAGTRHSCVVTRTGAVRCWGWNVVSQLGDPGATEQLNAVAVAAGFTHTCALTKMGGVKCWGYNYYGLGDGTTAQRYVPVDVVGLTGGVAAIAAGSANTCALMATGGVKCWGADFCTLSDAGLTCGAQLTPADVPGLTTGVVGIAAGGTHACAIMTGGGVKCWGRVGTQTYLTTPGDVGGLAGAAVALAAGTDHTCALIATGAVQCWGDNTYGALGNGRAGEYEGTLLTARDVVGLTSGVVAVAAGDGHSCAVTSSGEAKCWGRNDYGELGDGTTTGRYTPVSVLGMGRETFSDFNGDNRSDLVWRNRITGEIVFWLMNGTSIGSEVRIAGPADRQWRIVGTADFNADGNPDLVMRHATTGENQIWLMTGTTHSGTLALPTVADTRWQIATAADFDADGQPDLLWRNAGNGDVVVWYIDGGAYAGWSQVASIKDPTWVMAGVADFNGDGKPYIVWHNASTGESLVWYMNGAAYAGWATLPSEPDTSWVIVGVADYDADAKPDLLRRNVATGENRLWRMDGVTLQGVDALPGMSDAEYEFAGAAAGRTQPALGDFNVDGVPDILWHNAATGESRVWYMAGSNGDTRLADVSIGTETDLNWGIVAVADFNRDGLPDIVWRHGATGANKIALMSGHNKTGEMALPTIPDANWHIVGVGDFNQDGHPDLAWRNYVTGDNIIWFLQNGEYFDWTAPPTIRDTNWKIVAVGDFNGDGWPDLFWRNTATGENIAWFLVRGVYVGWGAPPTIREPSWEIVGANDYNRDGKADLLWRNATTGENLIWYLQDGAYIGWAALPTLGIDWSTGSSPVAVTIAFGGLSGTPDLTPITEYIEAGFAVSSVSGTWRAMTVYGNPKPAVILNRLASEPTVSGELQVTASGAPFSFSSVDLYSSVTPIPYTIIGRMKGATVFTLSDTVPNPRGLFVTIQNTNSTAPIDALSITLSNPAALTDNRVGLDNIVVKR